MKITSENYVQNVLRSESCNFSEIEERVKPMLRLLHVGFGLTTEVGEFMDQLKKHVFYGQPLDFVNLIEELSDLLWYVGMACDDLDITFDELLQRNIDKLRVRYPDKFSKKNALERNLEGERDVLEG